MSHIVDDLTESQKHEIMRRTGSSYRLGATTDQRSWECRIWRELCALKLASSVHTWGCVCFNLTKQGQRIRAELRRRQLQPKAGR